MRQRPPGQLRADVNPDVIMMICTAGHVDHGKTQLVKLLTGCNTDVLKTEQERGLTIELGFAPCFLGNNLAVGIVDVPGHEKFVKNMVAGVSGIAMTVLVIAADDGVMPQTVEHLQIMQLMGVRHGMVALTKTDLVPEETVNQRVEEIRAFLEGTFLEGADICPVSSETFDGYSEFYDVLVGRIRGIVKQRQVGVFRMPIERVFSQRGFGSIVTGIPVGGTVRLGDQVELVPGGITGKVRGIQCFLRDASEGSYGQCLALNIPDFSKQPPVRGQTVGQPGYMRPARIFHVRVNTIQKLEPPLRNADEIKFHTGTAEEHGKIYLLEEKTLEGGGGGLATVVVANAVSAAVNDRFIVRRPSPAATVGGGDILAVSYTEHRPKRKVILEKLHAYEKFFAGVDMAGDAGTAKKVEYFLRFEHPTGATVQDLSRETLLPVDIVTGHLSRMVDDETVIAFGPEQYIHTESYSARLDEIEARVRTAAVEGKQLSMAVSDLRRGCDWPVRLWARIEHDLERGNVVTLRGDTFILKSSVDTLPESDRAIIARLTGIYEDTGFRSPRPDELPDMVDAPQNDIARLLDYMCNEGQLVRLAKHVVLSRSNIEKAQNMVVAEIQENGWLDSAEFKLRIDSTRKYALAILDYLDARKVTIRTENIRKLAPNFERNLLRQ